MDRPISRRRGCRCGRPRKAPARRSAAAGTCRPRRLTRRRCCPPSRRTPSPPTPSPASWCSTRCAGSAPPSSKPSTPAATPSGSSTNPGGPTSPAPTSPTPAPAARRSRRRHPRRRPPPHRPAARRDARPGRAGGHLPAVRADPPRPGPPTPGAGVAKSNHRYGADRGTWPTRPARLLAGFTRILHRCRELLRPGGIVVITARPWREHGELIDLPPSHRRRRRGRVMPLERCVALLAAVRDGELVARPSFFQLHHVRKARAAATHALIAHEDVLISPKSVDLREFRRPRHRHRYVPVAPDDSQRRRRTR